MLLRVHSVSPGSERSVVWSLELLILAQRGVKLCSHTTKSYSRGTFRGLSSSEGHCFLDLGVTYMQRECAYGNLRG